MATDNKKIVQKTKEVLRDLGYDVKTNHIYEMYSRVAGYKSWHVAKTRDVDFSEQIQSPSSHTQEALLKDILNLVSQSRVENLIDQNVLIQAKKLRELNLSSYEKKIKNNEFKNVFNYGLSLESKEFITANPIDEPGAIFCGGMGSGKSVAMRFSLATHIFSNSENTIYILYDGIKGMTDYKSFFNLDNVFPVINDPSRIVSIINWIYEEMMERKKSLVNLIFII